MVHLVEHFSASPEKTFDAWLDPEVVSLWMFKSPSNEIMYADIDPQAGGAFSILERNGDELIDHFGKYLEITRPFQLIFTLEVPKHFKGTTLITVQFDPEPGGSVLTFTQTGIGRENAEDNWRDTLQELRRVLELAYGGKEKE